MAYKMTNKLKNESIRETFLVIDASRMHEEAMVENAASQKNWEWYVREKIFTDCQYTLCTRAMFTYPKHKKTSVILTDAFPVLHEAKVSSIYPKFIPDRQEMDTLGNVDLHFCSAFDTKHYGKVHMLGISVISSPAFRNMSKLQMGMLTSSPEEEGIVVPGEKRGKLTLSMTNLGKPEEIFLFLVTMIVPFSGCRFCGRKGRHLKTTHPEMLKCGRCWKKNHFPVWYCDQECQKADFPRHSRNDGCGR